MFTVFDMKFPITIAYMKYKDRNFLDFVFYKINYIEERLFYARTSPNLVKLKANYSSTAHEISLA